MNDLHYGVVVGINRYPGFSDLLGARKDAEKFQAWLTSPDGGAVPSENIMAATLTDDEARKLVDIRGARPTAGEVHGLLGKLNKRVRDRTNRDPAAFEQTRLYIFVAGHGIAPHGSDLALLMADMEAETETYNHLDLTRLRQWYLECSPFKELIIFADCCRTSVGSDGQGPPWPSCTGEHPQLRVAVGVAAAHSQSAREDIHSDEVDGFFTRSLLARLGGGASGASGEITADTLNDYVSRSVQALTGATQVAAVRTWEGQPIVFRDASQPILSRPLRTVRISFPQEFRDRVDILREDLSVSATWTNAPAPWDLQLEEGQYVLEAHGSRKSTRIQQGFTVIAKDTDVELNTAS